MKVYRIGYELGNDNYTAGVLADDKDKALAFLKKVVRNIKKIVSISEDSIDVHAIDDDIIDRVIKKIGKSELQEHERKIESLRNKKRAIEQEYRDYRSDMEEKIKMMEEELVTVRSNAVIKSETVHETVKVFICDICEAEMKTKAGLAAHKTKMHSDGKKPAKSKPLTKNEEIPVEEIKY